MLKYYNENSFYKFKIRKETCYSKVNGTSLFITSLRFLNLDVNLERAMNKISSFVRNSNRVYASPFVTTNARNKGIVPDTYS